MTFAPLFTAAALGLASGAHCTLMCGPLVTGACASKGRVDRAEAARYLLARAASYSFLGVVAASVGRPIIPAAVGAFVQIGVAVVVATMLVLRAWRALRWKTSETSDGLVPLRVRASGGGVARLLRSVARTGLGLGLITAVFPCGLLFAALLVATTAGSSALGAASMLVFALATAPFLVAALLVGDRAVRWARAERKSARTVGLAFTSLVAVAMIAVPVYAAVHRAPTSSERTTMPTDCPFHRR